MTNALRDNAYHILGLDSTANQRDISKRSKEIINCLKIDEIPRYDSDLNLFENFRSEASTKQAQQNLSAPGKRIKEYFFWFQILNVGDQQATELLKNKNYPQAIHALKQYLEKNGEISVSQKNLAILYCLLLFREDNKGYLQASLSLWHKLLNSNLFWQSFIEAFKLHDQLGTSDEVVDAFKAQVVSYLSDLYAELSQAHNDPFYVHQFSQFFSATGTKIEKDLLSPIYKNINQAVEILEAMKTSEDGKLDDGESQTIKVQLLLIQDELNKLKDLGHYDDSKTKSMRDRAANAIRTVVLDLHNNLDETLKALTLIQTALQICGTAGMQSKINEDIQVMEKFRADALVVKPIQDLIDAEKFSEALQFMDTEKSKHMGNEQIQDYFLRQRKVCVSCAAVRQYREAHACFDKGQHRAAERLFEKVKNLLSDNLDYYNFNKEALDKLIVDLKAMLSRMTVGSLAEVDKYRTKIMEVAKKNFSEQFEETILIALVDSYLYPGVIPIIEKFKHKNQVANVLYTLGWITVWFYGIGFIFFIMGWAYKNRNT